MSRPPTSIILVSLPVSVEVGGLASEAKAHTAVHTRISRLASGLIACRTTFYCGLIILYATMISFVHLAANVPKLRLSYDARVALWTKYLHSFEQELLDLVETVVVVPCEQDSLKELLCSRQLVGPPPPLPFTVFLESWLCPPNYGFSNVPPPPPPPLFLLVVCAWCYWNQSLVHFLCSLGPVWSVHSCTVTARSSSSVCVCVCVC